MQRKPTKHDGFIVRTCREAEVQIGVPEVVLWSVDGAPAATVQRGKQICLAPHRGRSPSSSCMLGGSAGPHAPPALGCHKYTSACGMGDAGSVLSLDLEKADLTYPSVGCGGNFPVPLCLRWPSWSS